MDDITILDSQITASSSRSGNPAKDARPFKWGPYWASETARPSVNLNIWIKVDLKNVKTVTEIETLGSTQQANEWVTHLQVQYGETEETMSFITEGWDDLNSPVPKVRLFVCNKYIHNGMCFF